MRIAVRRWKGDRSRGMAMACPMRSLRGLYRDSSILGIVVGPPDPIAVKRACHGQSVDAGLVQRPYQ
jgi:hypothetical protein